MNNLAAKFLVETFLSIIVCETEFLPQTLNPNLLARSLAEQAAEKLAGSTDRVPHIEPSLAAARLGSMWAENDGAKRLPLF